VDDTVSVGIGRFFLWYAARPSSGLLFRISVDVRKLIQNHRISEFPVQELKGLYLQFFTQL
jgi:hypothetical protein